MKTRVIRSYLFRVLAAGMTAAHALALDPEDLIVIPVVELDQDEEAYSGELVVHPLDGSVHVGWVKRGDIHYRIRYFDGTWSEVQVLPDGGAIVEGWEEGTLTERCFTMTFDDAGVLHLVFADSEGTLFSINDRGTGDWTTPEFVLYLGGHIIFPEMVSLGDELHLVFEDADLDLIYYAKYDQGWQFTGSVFALGETPGICKGTDGRIYFYYRGTREALRNVGFRYLLPGGEWTSVHRVTNAETYLGHNPHMAVADGKMYIAWPNQTTLPWPDQAELFCAYAEEPGLSWISRHGGGLYYDSIHGMRPQVAIYSDGTVFITNGVRYEERFIILYQGFWSSPVTAPWDDGNRQSGIVPEAVSDGQTVWVLSSENRIALWGIRNPEAELYLPPKPAILADVREGPVPLTVQFSGRFVGEVDTWSWDFGDGQTSILQDPVHVYAEEGAYTVSLTITGPWGQSTKSEAEYILVTDPTPRADFQADPTLGTIPLTVQFTDLSGGTINSWLWAFGDGGTSTERHPVHLYETTGVFTVTLDVSGPAGWDSITIPELIDARGAPPVAEFSADPTQGVRPLAVRFTDGSTGEIDAWTWDFGDGTTDNTRNPLHTYAEAGTYDVALTVDGPWGSSVKTKEDYITVDFQPPSANFSVEPSEGLIPLSVQFTDLSEGDIDGWEWDFGNGETSTDRHPAVVYPLPGDYDVTLTVTGAGGTDTLVREGIITALAPVPVAGFVADPTRGIIPLNVQFTDESTGDVDSWSWSFGDGTNSDQQHPTHVYGNAGSYDVALTVTGPWGTDTKTVAGYIRAELPAPVADFSADPKQGMSPLEVIFTDLSSGDIDSWLWTFGDGSTSQEANPTHLYTQGGVYDVRLTVSGPAGSDTKSVEDCIEVTSPPLFADFTADVLTGSAPLTVQFTDLSTGEIDTWLWEFGDGHFSSDRNPAHTYVEEGVFTVGLTVANGERNNTTAKDSYITVEPASDVLLSEMPRRFRLYPNFPNPFNPSTRVRYDLPGDAEMQIAVFDLKGKRLQILAEGRFAGGSHDASWDGTDESGARVPSGMYLIVMRAEGFCAQQKVLFMK